ncbi:antibiotic ABC transporter [Paracoccus sp. 11-3]|uniref:Antibiotic ABC transporter n=1 Tax=Paracoccus amoyensis TaxID=2760093 RepID=A0A926GH96_9RHOB|nr:antibiotic ABC transporter [Paracoccus amoyensis]MBC9248252.1 antibiotic ABC transporter [Paracoccus amoyensis]
MYPIGTIGSPADAMRVWAQVTRLAIESQMVIGLRVAGMMGVISQSPGEPFRMVAEKHAAASESLFAIARSAGRGDSADRMISAALRPYGRRTRANSRRLIRRG